MRIRFIAYSANGSKLRHKTDHMLVILRHFMGSDAPAALVGCGVIGSVARIHQRRFRCAATVPPQHHCPSIGRTTVHRLVRHHVIASGQPFNGTTQLSVTVSDNRLNGRAVGIQTRCQCINKHMVLAVDSGGGGQCTGHTCWLTTDSHSSHSTHTHNNSQHNRLDQQWSIIHL